MLRECARYEALAKTMLQSNEVLSFFRYVQVPAFNVASDAFSTFKVSANVEEYAFIVLIRFNLLPNRLDQCGCNVRLDVHCLFSLFLSNRNC